MRVLFPFFKRSFGGSDKSSLEIIKILSSEGYVVSAFLQQPNAPLEKELSEMGVAFVKHDVSWCFLGRGFDLLLTPYWISRFCIYLIVNRIDIVHTNDKQSHFNWVLASFICGVKHIWHQRTLLHLNKYRSCLIRMATQVVGVSSYCLSCANLSFLKNKPLVINHAVAFPAVDFCVRTERQRVTVGFFGGLRSEKRPFLFLDFAERLVSLGNEHDFFFEVYGESTDISVADFESAICSKGMCEYFVYRGFVSDSAECMAGCDFVVSMWPQEAYGRVSIEAALVGSVPVAANVAGYAEVISHGVSGLLIDDYDSPTAYAWGILNFLDMELSRRQEFRLKARSHACEQFSYSAYSKKILDLYLMLSK